MLMFDVDDNNNNINNDDDDHDRYWRNDNNNVNNVTVTPLIKKFTNNQTKQIYKSIEKDPKKHVPSIILILNTRYKNALFPRLPVLYGTGQA